MKTNSYFHSSKPFSNKNDEGSFFSKSKGLEEPFFSPQTIQPKWANKPVNEKEEGLGTDKIIKQTELAVQSPNPDSVPKKLSEVEIQDAISYNIKKFKNEKEIKTLKDVLGLSSDSAEIDDEFVKYVAQWQAKNELKEDGKIGPRTAAVIGYEMLGESKIDTALKPDAIKMLERGIVISLPGNNYTDTAVDSQKNITFSVHVPKGLKREDYALVNWVKGHMKTGGGGFFKAKMYGVMVDSNYTSYQVDSVDTDPIYWSKPGSRWEFNKVGNRKFTAKDSPGPALNTEVGADYDLDFKLQVYRLSDLPAVTGGNLGGAESKAIATVFWDYKVKVSATGTFTH